jgi:hypothetical protein
MQSSNVPTKFPIPFANSAGALYTRTIPQASQIGVQDGAASLTDGFPPKCFVPVASGGTPPFGKDFNGLLKQVTQWDQWQQAGGPIVYDSAFQASIGGYPMGAIIEIVAGGPAFMSTAENNTVAPAVGAAGWMPAPTFGSNVTTVTETGSLTIYNAGLILVNATAGNITITMPAVSGANGVPLPFSFTRTDSSANTVTIVGAGSDAFFPKGGSSLGLPETGSVQLMGDGVSKWVEFSQSTGRLIGVQVFTSSGTYTPTPGATLTIFEGSGGGGAGAGFTNPGSGAASAGGGGSAGAFGWVKVANPTSQTITIGAGGVGVSAGSGGNGGTTSVGSILILPGGGGAAVANIVTAASFSGVEGFLSAPPSGATVGSVGNQGNQGIILSIGSGQGGKGGDSPYGAGGLIASTNSIGSAFPGNPANGYGSGGGGAIGLGNSATEAGGNGASGIIIAWEYS